ncbi:MAG: nitroreductase/quinone reductase family protein [Nitriliruptorales bacterium]|nr:nitroreductase/quinone reductase family protein [Nitriliruptorales bacterium]
MTDLPDYLHDERYCYLTTQGRVTGRRHTAELWFIPTEGGVYLMSGSGGLTQWCLNLQAEEQGVVRVGGRSWLGRASFLSLDDDEREDALQAFHDKYDPPGKDRFQPWLRSATVVQMVFTREVAA